MEHAMKQMLPETVAVNSARRSSISAFSTGPSGNLSKLPPVAEFAMRLIAWSRGKLRAKAAADCPLRLVSQLALGGKRMVSLIEADGVRFLVGGGADNVAIIFPVSPEPQSFHKNNALIQPDGFEESSRKAMSQS